MTPLRVQRKRVKGYKLPPNTACVNRPSKWGNPFKLVGDMIYVDAGHRCKYMDRWVYLCQGDIEKVLRLYKTAVTGLMQVGEYGIEVDNFDDILHWVKHFKELNVAELKGKNLACFCPLRQPCHADVLLGLANE